MKRLNQMRYRLRGLLGSFVLSLLITWISFTHALSAPLIEMNPSLELNKERQNQSGSNNFNFLAIDNDSALVRFVAFGDTGSGLPGQFAIARQLMQYFKANPFVFAVLLGDIIYPDGDFKHEGQQKYKQPYQGLFEEGVRFLAVLGNHDLLRGYMPGLHHFYGIPNNYYDYRVENVHFFALDTTHFDQRQQVWLKDRLSKTQSGWKVVYGHHPVYSSGLHGSTTSLIKTLKPLLEAYHVDLYLSGHDHDYERFKPIGGIQYFVSGGGGAILRNFFGIKKHSLVRKKVHHFLAFEIQGDTLTFKAIDRDGHVFDQGVINKK